MFLCVSFGGPIFGDYQLCGWDRTLEIMIPHQQWGATSNHGELQSALVCICAKKSNMTKIEPRIWTIVKIPSQQNQIGSDLWFGGKSVDSPIPNWGNNTFPTSDDGDPQSKALPMIA